TAQHRHRNRTAPPPQPHSTATAEALGHFVPSPFIHRESFALLSRRVLCARRRQGQQPHRPAAAPPSRNHGCPATAVAVAALSVGVPPVWKRLAVPRDTLLDDRPDPCDRDG